MGNPVSLTFRIEDDGKGLKNLIIDGDGLRKVMEASVTEAKKLQNEILTVSGVNNIFNTTATQLSQVAGIFKDMTGEVAQFNTAMRAANTMAGKDAAGFGQLKKDVTELAKEVPVARDMLANGLYQVISNGVPEDNWMEFLRASARSSVGGLADLNQAVIVTSTLIKNYGLEWSAAAEIQDKIQLTAKNGVTSFEQLAQALPSVAGSAATLGVSVNDLMAAFATLTGVSGNTAEVSTQLGAVFKALVSPSSEAATMAKDMGIQFDAASVKAAGGLQKFLVQLQASVAAYSRSSGILEEEVYAKLFGSARALRALTPITGELANKFEENVAVMAGSAGTMDAAFDEMANTAESRMQRVANAFAPWRDAAGSITGYLTPVLSILTTMVSTAASVTVLCTNIKALTKATTVCAAVKSLFSKIVASARTQTVGLTGAVVAETTATRGATTAARVFGVTLKTAFIGTGVGLAIIAIVTAIQALIGTSKEASDTVDNLGSKLSEGEECQKVYAEAAAKAEQEIQQELGALKSLTEGSDEAASMIAKLNEKYGGLVGAQSSVASWYKTLSALSKDYVEQLALEAEMTEVVTRLGRIRADKSINDAALNRMKNDPNIKAFDAAQSRGDWVGVSSIRENLGKDILTKNLLADYEKLQKDQIDLFRGEQELLDLLKPLQTKMDQAKKKIDDIKNQNVAAVDVNKLSINDLKKRIGELDDALVRLPGNADSTRLNKLIAEREKYQKRLDKLEVSRKQKKAPKEKKTPKSETIERNPKSVADYEKNIRLTIQSLHTLTEAEQKNAKESIQAWAKKRDALQLTLKKESLPINKDSLDAIEKYVSYYNELYRLGDEQQRQQAIRASHELATQKKMMELKSQKGTLPQIEEIRTYDQLDASLSYYTSLLEVSEAAQRIAIQKTIDKLNKKREAMEWGDGNVDPNSAKGIGKQISDLEEQKERATSVQDVFAIEQKITALREKQSKMDLGAQAAQMFADQKKMLGFSPERLKRTIKDMGFDGLTRQIQEARDLMADMGDDLDDATKKQFKSYIKQLNNWRKSSINGVDEVRKGWGHIKGISSGVSDLTSALTESDNAWEGISGTIDAFLELYDGIMGIVEMVKQLNEATKISKTLTEAETMASQENAGAKLVEMGASQAAAQAKSGEALADATESGAKLPFPANIIAIAAGVAAVVAALATVIGSFAEGGIVGGNSWSGDKLTARVNSGEMILNQRQQRNLFRLINNPSLNGVGQNVTPNIGAPNLAAIANAPRQILVSGTTRVHGRDLEIVLANETRVGAKSGRRTRIKV